MKLYTYQNNYENIRIFQTGRVCEVWIYTAAHTFSWFLALKNDENILDWFLEVIKNNINVCLINLIPRYQFINQEFAKQQLTECLQELSTLSTKDFNEYICTRP